MNRLSKAAQFVREELGLSRQEMACELDMDETAVSRIERGLRHPRPSTIARYREVWGIDLYMVAVAFFTDYRKVPAPLRKRLKALELGWRNQISEVVARRGRL